MDGGESECKSRFGREHRGGMKLFVHALFP